MKNALAKLAFALIIAINCTFSAFAAELNIKINAPEGFDERVEVYLNAVAHPFYHGYYEGTLELEDGTYKVVVISPTDTYDVYSYTPSTLLIDTETDNTLTIDVEEKETEAYTDYDVGLWDDYVPTEEYIIPSEYDFSEGQPYGTIDIKSNGYAALLSATYELVGNDTVYTVTLDRDHNFWATVKLPAASYYESSSIHVELDSDASIPEGLDFLWRHNGEDGFFGKYYDVTDGGTSSIDDLKIMMVYDGEMEEVDSDLLFYSTAQDNRFKAQERHIKEKLESAFPQQFTESEAETETETIAIAEPEQEPDQDGAIDLSVVFIILTIAAFLLISVIAIIAIRKRKSKR